MLTKDYINPISIYNTHLCPAPARKQSFLIFSIYSTRFNEICFFFSTVPKGTWPRGERNWSAAKDKFKKMKGNTNPNFLQEYLKEFMWRRWHGELHPNGCLDGWWRTLQNNIHFKYPEVGGRGTPMYMYMPRNRVWFWPVWSLNKIYKLYELKLQWLNVQLNKKQIPLKLSTKRFYRDLCFAARG